MISPDISVGNLITVGAFLIGNLVTYVKQQSSQETFKDYVTLKLVKIEAENIEQNKLLASQDKIIAILNTNLEERLKSFDDAIKANKDWRHEVAGQFMRETSLQVFSLDKEVTILQLALAQIKLDVVELKAKRVA